MLKVVALHGFTGSHEDFEPMKSYVNHDAVEVITPDWPGHGKKKHETDPKNYSINAHMDIITESIGSSRKIILLGYSMGGRLALNWAINNPGKIEKLILIGASPGIADEAESQERLNGDQALAQFIRNHGVRPFIKYWNGKTFFRPLMSLPPDRLDPILERRFKNTAEGLALSLESVGTASLPSLWPRLNELRCKVDIVVGEKDPKFVEIAHRMGECLPKARISVIEFAGHAVHLEYPSDCAKLLEV
jgi:2-succinyl-6-hydroxy-2,4-cyclohexadiene-1-carboxylate synthase